MTKGVPASPSGYSAEPEPSSTVSAVPVSIPNAARCGWCDTTEAELDDDGLCEMCRDPLPPPQKTFDTSVITERLNDINVRFLEPLIKKAADNFYCQVLDTVDDYLLENLSFNMSSHVKMLERENQRMRTELWEVDKTLGCHSLGHETRLNAIKQGQHDYSDAMDKLWKLRAEYASAIEARRAETGNTDSVHESAGPKDDAQTPSPVIIEEGE